MKTAEITVKGKPVTIELTPEQQEQIKKATEDITDKVKTFEDACEALGLDPGKAICKNDSDDKQAYDKLKIISKALNQGWVPDWSNSNERKWYPWFEYSKNKSGFGFADADYDCARTITSVGSPLCFQTSDLAEYAGKQFIDIYNTFLN